MKPLLKINFSDFWPGFDPNMNQFHSALSEHYQVQLSEQPDLLFYSCYGHKYLQFRCARLFYTGENMRPDFVACDYAIAFDYLIRENYFRMPLYTLYLGGDLKRLLQRNSSPEHILQSKTKFCNMVVSNPNCKKRIEFFEKLSKYKKVDSGGKVLNNVGGPVAEKAKFIRDYKFTFAFENSSYPGYTTEKIVEPMLENSIPLYWGNPMISKEFNSKSFLNYHEYGSDEAMIERIIAMDKNDELFLQCVSEPHTTRDLTAEIGFAPLTDFLKRVASEIVDQKPVAKTFRGRLHDWKRSAAVMRRRIRNKLGIKGISATTWDQT